MPSHLLGHTLRAVVKRHLFRRPAFNVPLHSRQLIRRITSCFDRRFPGSLAGLHILPISSVEWTSEMLETGEAKIIIFDVEQHNALGFLAVRHLALERPIFHYNEYVIRIGELLLGLGNIEAALRITQVNHARLEEYSQIHGCFPNLPRPQSMQGLQDFLTFEEIITPAFLMGHEIGHFLYKHRWSSVGKFAMVRELWNEAEYVESEGVCFSRFLLPHTIQKFDDLGLPNGQAVITTKTVELIPELREKIVGEIQADYIGLIAATELAKDNAISAQALFIELLTALEGMERLLLLRLLTERLPHKPRRASVELESSTIEARAFMLVTMIREVASGQLAWTPEAKEFWSQAPFQASALSEHLIDQLANLFGMSRVVARGAMYLGSGGAFPKDLPSKQIIRALYGPFGGNIEAHYFPFRLPASTYTLSDHSDWSPDSGADPGLVGFSCAIRDLTRALIRPETIDKEYGKHYLNEGKKPSTDILNLIRYPRLMVMNRNLDERPSIMKKKYPSYGRTQKRKGRERFHTHQVRKKQGKRNQ